MTISLLTVITALGWIGAIAVVLAYGMVSKGRWTADGLPFQLANFAGAFIMLLIAVINGIWPSALANVAAVIIGALAMRTIARSRRAERSAAAQVTGVAGAVAVVDGSQDPAAGGSEPVVTEVSFVDELETAERVDLAA
ncbi:CBU_0592 family membrane protein [Isoptericola cucumis]|uniref:CBU-0592-like domain-containing protein n=1 Tax=Isoptericola cucumis TaxID=1776856 RepID=A0ABQ2BA24_9MICO|nr:hypothetical protein [Isoptericola cucumis]GGI10509.1 hypothetical protein GCM10007368_31590 [Isoptericola cucumis]